jgi:hypothetical protein
MKRVNANQLDDAFDQGAAACGSWVCFDEYHRIPARTLSIGAELLNALQRAIMARQPRLHLDGVEVQLRLTAGAGAIFTTTTFYQNRSSTIPKNFKV